MDQSHEQKVNEKGWVSHDPMEIYHNVISVVRRLLEESGIDRELVSAVGITNQRETTVAWDEHGVPFCDAIVWQCSRASELVNSMKESSDLIYQRTGLPLSPYFPAAKMRWLLENVIGDRSYHIGTMDTWLVYKLTGGKCFKTDYSNASRTQLLNLHSLSWDEELCRLFHVNIDSLPEVCDSDAFYGETDFEGIFDKAISIHAVLGDSHSALFAQQCHTPGMVKATYGTGSSIMMNIGEEFTYSKNGLATSLAWGLNGRVEYVLEGNINYTGAVITWLKDQMGLIHSTDEIEALIAQAEKEDNTVLVPAFTGLSAPYWNNQARAAIIGMSRTTGKAELVKAAVECIALQIMDVITAMEADSGTRIEELRVDGGPTHNAYLMQFQSDILKGKLRVSQMEELSAIGTGYLAGIAAGVYEQETLFSTLHYQEYEPLLQSSERERKIALWKEAVGKVL